MSNSTNVESVKDFKYGEYNPPYECVTLENNYQT